jgi:hypothetical protein
VVVASGCVLLLAVAVVAAALNPAEGVNLADGHANQIHNAAAIGLQALTLARQTGSARTETELCPLAATLTTWRTQPDVATFIDALTA